MTLKRLCGPDHVHYSRIGYGMASKFYGPRGPRRLEAITAHSDFEGGRTTLSLT